MKSTLIYGRFILFGLLLIGCEKENSNVKNVRVKTSETDLCPLKAIVYEYQGNDQEIRCAGMTSNIQKDSLVLFCDGFGHLDSTHLYRFSKGEIDLIDGYFYERAHQNKTYIEYSLADVSQFRRIIEFDESMIVKKITYWNGKTANYENGISDLSANKTRWYYLNNGNRLSQVCNYKERSCTDSTPDVVFCLSRIYQLEESFHFDYHKLAVLTNMFSWSGIFKIGTQFDCTDSYYLHPLLAQEYEEGYCINGFMSTGYAMNFFYDYEISNHRIQRVYSHVAKTSYHQRDFIETIDFYYKD